MLGVIFNEYYLDVILINELKKPAQVVRKCESIETIITNIKNSF